MTSRIHPIVVKQLPQPLSLRKERAFLADLAPHLRIDRPRIVLDCSTLGQMDRAALQLILYCLEEAMKRNGDVKLAGLSEASAAVLNRTGVNQLFETYETPEDAAHSFRRLAVHPSDAVTKTGNFLRQPKAGAYVASA